MLVLCVFSLIDECVPLLQIYLLSYRAEAGRLAGRVAREQRDRMENRREGGREGA